MKIIKLVGLQVIRKPPPHHCNNFPDHQKLSKTQIMITNHKLIGKLRKYCSPKMNEFSHNISIIDSNISIILKKKNILRYIYYMEYCMATSVMNYFENTFNSIFNNNFTIIRTILDWSSNEQETRFRKHHSSVKRNQQYYSLIKSRINYPFKGNQQYSHLPI